MPNNYLERSSVKCVPSGTPDETTPLCMPTPPRVDWIIPLDPPGPSAEIHVDTAFGDDYLPRAMEEYFIVETTERLAMEIWEQLSSSTDDEIPYMTGVGMTGPDGKSITAPEADIPEGDSFSGGGGGGGTSPKRSGKAKIDKAKLNEITTGALTTLGILQKTAISELAAMLAGKIGEALSSLFSDGTTYNSITFEDLVSMLISTLVGALESTIASFAAATSSGGGGGGSGAGAPQLDVETDPTNKAMEFLNELEPFYQELFQVPPIPEFPYVEPEWWVPLILGPSGTTLELNVRLVEALSKISHTYEGYREGAAFAFHFPVGFPLISFPGEYSFMDGIDQNLKTVKRRALKSVEEAQLLLLVVPWLFTTNPNRAREANRRARELKQKIFKIISIIPSMLDLWDGLGEWTTPYLTQNELDKSQLKFEMWGDYLGGTPKHPQLVRDSVWRKHFSEDRVAIQKTYNTTNDFFQYCCMNAWNWSEKVENGRWYEKTTTYKTMDQVWVGERLKGDMFYHLVVQFIANPFPIALFCIGLSKYLIEYIVHQTEIVEIQTYDLTGLEDLRHLSYHDYRGFKRTVPFRKLDRSGLDVIDDE